MAQNEQTTEEHSLHAGAAVTGKARVCRGTTARYHSVPTDVVCRRLAVCDSARSFVVVLSLVTQLTTAIAAAAAAAAEY